jgi:hypothetical protein
MIDNFEPRPDLPIGDCTYEISYRHVQRSPQDFLGLFQSYRLSHGKQLIQQRGRVAQATGCLTSNELGSIRLNFIGTFPDLFIEVAGYHVDRDSPEFMPLASGEHSSWDFVNLRRSQNKHGV